MTFLYPSFLWALGVLSIPVIIHLFNFRKTTRIFFSNNRFLRQVKEASTAKRKLKHYLILASRLLFLSFLVFAFAQPFIPAREQTVNYRNVVFYLDNSQSMSAPMKEKGRGLDAGISFITNMVNIFPSDSRYRLITNDFAPFSNSFKTKKEILDLLAQVRISPISRTVKEVRDRIIRSGSIRDQDVFWVSDFQKSTAGRPTLVSDTSMNWHLVPITFENLSNVFVDTAYLDNPFASSGEKNILRIRVRNDGTEDVDQLALKLMVNSVQMGATTIDVPKRSVNETSFDLTTRLTGLNKASVTFNDFPVAFDNEFFLTLNYKEKIRIIEVKGNHNVTPIERVYGNNQVFSYRGFAVSNFNYSQLTDADLVIVNGLNTVDASLSLALNEYRKKGGTVFVIPGKSPDEVSMRSLLQVPVYRRLPEQGVHELDKPDFSNPFFQNVFEEKSTSIIMPKATPVVDWGNDRSAILKFKNDRPFLSRIVSNGNLYLLACPLESPFTDFYNHALFVPVMYRLAASSKKNENKLYYSLPETFLSLRIDSVDTDNQVRLVNQEEIIPAQRRVGNQVLMDLPKFSLKTGFYKVIVAKDSVDLIAFNPDKAESLMGQFKDDELKGFFGETPNVRIFDAMDTDAFSKEIKERYLGTPLWKYAVLLALLFLVLEVLLIRFVR